MDIPATPIEDRAAWSKHREAQDRARELGACWDCSQRAGFAFSNKAGTRRDAWIQDTHENCKHAVITAIAEVEK